MSEQYHICPTCHCMVPVNGSSVDYEDLREYVTHLRDDRALNPRPVLLKVIEVLSGQLEESLKDRSNRRQADDNLELQVRQLRAQVARLALVLERRTWLPAMRPDQSLTGLCPDCLQSVDVGHHPGCGIRQAIDLTPEAIAADAEVLRAAEEWRKVHPEVEYDGFSVDDGALAAAVDRSRKARGAT